MEKIERLRKNRMKIRRKINRELRESFKKERAFYEWRKKKEVALKIWRKTLHGKDKRHFDVLRIQNRLFIFHGARSVLCDGHLIPNLPLELANKWNQEPLCEEWFSEKGKENLHRIKVEGFNQ